jgi:hypothetical protein
VTADIDGVLPRVLQLQQRVEELARRRSAAAGLSKLVPQRQDLHVLLAIAHRQQS